MDLVYKNIDESLQKKELLKAFMTSFIDEKSGLAYLIGESTKNDMEKIERENCNQFMELISDKLGIKKEEKSNPTGPCYFPLSFSEEIATASEPDEHFLKKEDKKYKIKLLCNWATSRDLSETWNKMSKGNYTWGNFRLVWDEEPDYFVIINCPPLNEAVPPDKTILFRMEPRMERLPHSWGAWSNPNKDIFLKTHFHSDTYNNVE